MLTQMHQMAYDNRFDDDSVDAKALPNPGKCGLWTVEHPLTATHFYVST